MSEDDLKSGAVQTVPFRRGGGIPSVHRSSFSPFSWLMLVAYPLLIPLGSYPIEVGSGSVSAEMIVAAVCAVAFLADTSTRSIRLNAPNGHIVGGLLVWIAANCLSGLYNHSPDLVQAVNRLILKAALAYMVYAALVNTGRLGTILKAYVAGCFAAGCVAVVFCIQTGGLEVLRQASYAGVFPGETSVSLFSGLARVGAGNLLPVWICVVAALTEKRVRYRVMLFTGGVVFLVLSLLALRREVLVEMAIGCLVMIFAVPRRHRVKVGMGALALTLCLVLFVGKSQSWQGRLTLETRDEIESSRDPRMVLLLNTPAELRQAPLLGHGPGSYPYRMIVYFYDRVLALDTGIAPHNSFSRAAVETGSIGLAGLCWMTGALGIIVVAERRRSAAHVLAIMVFLHIGTALFFGDGIDANTTWFLIGIDGYLCAIIGRRTRHKCARMKNAERWFEQIESNVAGNVGRR